MTGRRRVTVPVEDRDLINRVLDGHPDWYNPLRGEHRDRVIAELAADYDHVSAPVIVAAVMADRLVGH